MESLTIREKNMDSQDLQKLSDSGAFSGDIAFDVPLAQWTSLRIGGAVDVMAAPDDPLSLKNVLVTARRESIPLFVIGGGTNMLAADERIEGIALSMRKFRTIEPVRSSDEAGVVLHIGSGIPLAMLVNFAKEHGYSGIEALAGIPGQTGGAVFMNAGSFGTEIKDVLQSVQIMHATGDIEILPREQISFRYRRTELPAGAVILGANIRLPRATPEDVAALTREYLEKKKNSQPLGQPSAGCVFKNPEGDSAGRLIDAAGCKGMRAGDVAVSQVHANYFINRGNATCRDFLKLMTEVGVKVRLTTDRMLEPEVRIVGTHYPETGRESGSEE